MFKILGADGRECGPATTEQILQWIADGRANAQTMAQVEGTADWKPLASFAEFTATLGVAPTATPPRSEAGAPPPPPPPPIPGPVNAEARAAEIIARDYQIDIGSCISRGWELVKANFWLLVGASFLVNLVFGAGGILFGPLFAGLYLLFLKRIRNQPGTVGDAFCGLSIAFLQTFLGCLVMTLLIVVALVLCLIPG